MATPDSRGEKILLVGRTKNKSSKFKDAERGNAVVSLQSTTDLLVLPPRYRRIGLNSLEFHLEK